MAQQHRLWIVIGILVGALILLNSVGHGETVIARQPLRELSYLLGDWYGDEIPLDQQVVQAVGVTDYINRFYARKNDPPIQMYVGYYASQRTGDTIHSPKNCLPGAGWEPVRSGYATIAEHGVGPLVVNEYVVQQDQNRQLVFYWYQGRGRIIASEYWGKFWMIADAISRDRTDSALVRLNTPVAASLDSARTRLTRFAELLFPQLSQFIPR